MKAWGRRWVLFFFFLINCGREEILEDMDAFQIELWASPPERYRPYFRWWWPGGSVEEKEIRRELKLFKDNGFGGVEIQPFTFCLYEEDISKDPNIMSVGTEEFFEKLKTALKIAKEFNLKVDLTFGSSWPSGGPFIKDGKAKQLVMSVFEVEGPLKFEGKIPLPEEPQYYDLLTIVQDISKTSGEFDRDFKLLATIAGKKGEKPDEIVELKDISDNLSEGILRWDVPEGKWFIFGIYENFTNQLVFCHAYPGNYAESFVLDHLNRKGIEEMVEEFGEKVIEHLKDFIGNTLESIFIDSFELFSTLPWTDGFLEKFQREMGYDLKTFLPILFKKFGEIKWLETIFKGSPKYSYGEIGERVREDYEEIRSELFRDEFLRPLLEWVHKKGLTLRLQNHGGYQNFLEGYSMVDIPETEQLYAGGSYDFMKLASSSAHISGKRFVSSETFVSASGDPKKLKEKDFYYLAGRAFSAGVNRIYYHGYPYLYYRKGRRWYPFDKPELLGFSFTTWTDEDSPVWKDIKKINEYITRLSYAMSRGRSSAEVAWLYNDLTFKDKIVFGFRGDVHDSEMTKKLQRAGLTYDRISPYNLMEAHLKDGKIEVGVQKYSALLMDNLKAAYPEAISKVKDIVEAGIPVVILGGLPERAIGYRKSEERDSLLKGILREIEGRVKMVSTPEEAVDSLLEAGIKPPLIPENRIQVFDIIHRSVKNGEVFLIFNGTEEAQREVFFIGNGRKGTLFDPLSGKQKGRSKEGYITVEIPPSLSLLLFIEK